MTKKILGECKGGRRAAMTIWSCGTCTVIHKVGGLQQAIEGLRNLVRADQTAKLRKPKRHLGLKHIYTDPLKSNWKHRSFIVKTSS